jgi:hypothetical protein
VLSSSSCPPVLASAHRSQFQIRLNQLLHDHVCLVRQSKNNDASILQHLEILLVETIKYTILGVLQNQKHIRTLTQIWETQQTTHRVPCTLEIKTTVVFMFLLRPPLHHLSHATVIFFYIGLSRWHMGPTLFFWIQTCFPQILEPINSTKNSQTLQTIHSC